MTDLDRGFDRLRRTGDYREALLPLLRARLFVAGAVAPPGTPPVFYARLSDVTGAPCLTATEDVARIAGGPGVVPMPFTGIDLIFAMDAAHDLVVLKGRGTEYLEAGQVEWFRETVRRNPFLRDEARA